MGRKKSTSGMGGLAIAGLLGATGVMAGAFGAHGLKSRGVDEALLKAWGTAAQYQLLHAVALLKVYDVKPSLTKWFVIGTILFSGSIYVMVLTGWKKLGIVTPIGGTVLLLSWLGLAF